MTCTIRLALLTAAIVAALAAPPAAADKPEWAGGGKGVDRAQKGRSDKAGPAAPQGQHFAGRHRDAVRDFYATEFKGGRCPPGLAKKQNGCMPPGQAKKWKVGQPLARDVVMYDLPPKLVTVIGIPPPGYKYVRVASDILMIAIGTSMVIDAIDDLGRR